MSNTRIITFVTIVPLIGMLIRALWRSGMVGSRSLPNMPGHIVEYSRMFKITSWLFLLIPVIGIGVLVYFSPPQNRSDTISVIAMIVGFSLMGCWLVNESCTSIHLQEDSLTLYSPWRKNVILKWSEVISITFSRLFQWFVIRGADGKVIRANMFLRGFPTLIAYFTKNLDPNIFRPAVQKYYETPTSGL